MMVYNENLLCTSSGVQLSLHQCTYTVKDGVWCGVELDRKVGKHGGSVDGRRYFSCPPGFGILVPVHKLTPG